MELSDYEILGINENATFREVKNAYYDLSRIYHPDSTLKLSKKISLNEKLTGFKKIQMAYDNIKKKLNVNETDLPSCDIIYNDILKESLGPMEVSPLARKTSENMIDWQKKFNKEFEEKHSKQSIDNPYSIFYKKELIESTTGVLKNNAPTGLILKEAEFKDNPFEFGINYVEDHSSKNYTDLNQLNKKIITKEFTKQDIEPIKKKILDKKLTNLIDERNKPIKLNNLDKMFIDKQKQYVNESELIKQKIEKNRKKYYLNS